MGREAQAVSTSANGDEAKPMGVRHPDYLKKRLHKVSIAKSSFDGRGTVGTKPFTILSAL